MLSAWLLQADVESLRPLDEVFFVVKETWHFEKKSKHESMGRCFLGGRRGYRMV